MPAGDAVEWVVSLARGEGLADLRPFPRLPTSWRCRCRTRPGLPVPPGSGSESSASISGCDRFFFPVEGCLVGCAPFPARRPLVSGALQLLDALLQLFHRHFGLVERAALDAVRQGQFGGQGDIPVGNRGRALRRRRAPGRSSGSPGRRGAHRRCSDEVSAAIESRSRLV